MCGLIVSLGHRIGDREIDILKHRGPDGAGRREFETPAGPLVLGHRRLAIIDPDPRSDQPMATTDDKHHIVFNGEIYNYQFLRDLLLKSGCHLRTTSDTEALLLGYRLWGAAVLEHTIGMFAFAIADFERRVLFLARDQFGIKPLYWTRAAGRFACASEIKALLTLPYVSTQANADVAFDFLRHGLVEHRPESLFRDISIMRSGHWMEVSLDNARVSAPKAYWHPRVPVKAAGNSDEIAEDLRCKFDESVKLHLVSDVPVGATLSGGLDSTSIVSSITRDLTPGEKLATYSFIAEDEAVSEERWIDLMARQRPIQAHKARASFHDFLRDLDRLILAQDIPLQGPSIYAEYKVFELVHKTGMKVIVGGQGADELFGGYHPYMRIRILSLARSGKIAAALRLASVYAERAKLGWSGVGMQLLALAVPSMTASHLRPLPRWLDRGWLNRAGVRRHRPWRPSGGDALRQRLFHDVFSGSLPAHLRYEDHNAMLHSVESRVPFLVCRLAELAFSTPEEQLIASDGITKAIMRKAFADRLPADIVNRKDKIGFAAPDRAWLPRMAPTVAKVLDEAPARVGPIDTRALKEVWLAMSDGRRPIDTGLWRVFFFVKWAKLLNVEFAH
jgi:asparagine synthase (glutamine-hydrolysing)